MKITTKILSIPPYISTSWDSIDYLKSSREEEHLLLVIGLKSDLAPIIIPNLSLAILDEIFQAHVGYLEEKQTIPSLLPGPGLFKAMDQMISSLITPQENTTLVDTIMQHNPEHADNPVLPTDLLAKLLEATKDLALFENAIFEPTCQCMFCQIARAMQEQKQIDEEVDDADLHFLDWQVVEVSSKLYRVINPEDPQEVYNVYLGEPVGCTCGQKSCAHIEAVLKS